MRNLASDSSGFLDRDQQLSQRVDLVQMSHQIPEGLEPDQNPPPPVLSYLMMAKPEMGDKTFMSAGVVPWSGEVPMAKGSPK